MPLLTSARLREIAESLGRVIVVTGAGVSVPSGIPDFATTDKQWTEPVSREKALSLQYFLDEPEGFWSLYKKLFLAKSSQAFSPSPAHAFLTELERTAEVHVFTQNVDGLHQLAGSSCVTELHGTANTLTCVSCNENVSAASVYASAIPTCFTCGSRLKPDIVLYGESSTRYQQLFNALSVPAPGLLLVMGTSLTVAPVSYAASEASVNSPHLWRIYWDKNASQDYEPLFHHHLSTRFEDI